MLLNFFEGLAFGVNHRVYDEKLIQDAYDDVMKLTLFQFKDYINHHRHAGHANAWLEVEQLLVRWKSEQDAVQARRVPTGSGA